MERHGWAEAREEAKEKKPSVSLEREPSPDSLFTLTRLLLDLINNSWLARQEKKQESAKEERTNVLALKGEINYGDSHWRGGHDDVCVSRKFDNPCTILRMLVVSRYGQR